jgi:hypothetical protein
MQKKHVNINFVGKPLLIPVQFYSMKGVTLEGNTVHINSVGNPLGIIVT